MISPLSLSKFIRLQEDYRKNLWWGKEITKERELQEITGNAQNNQHTKGDEGILDLKHMRAADLGWNRDERAGVCVCVQMKEGQSDESKEVKSEQQVWICLGDRSFILQNWGVELCCSLRMGDGTWDWFSQTLVEVTPLVMWNVLLSANWQPAETLLSLWLGDQWHVEQQAKRQNHINSTLQMRIFWLDYWNTEIKMIP